MIIGITGKIGSGKSTACQYLQNTLSYKLISCDKLIHQLYQCPHVKLDLISKFQTDSKSEIINLDLSVGDILILGDIFIPYIIGYIVSLKNSNEDYIIEIPLLFENNLEYLCDITLNISTIHSIRRSRVIERHKGNYSMFHNMDTVQLPNRIRDDKADYSIQNNSNLNDLLEELNIFTYTILNI